MKERHDYMAVENHRLRLENEELRRQLNVQKPSVTFDAMREIDLLENYKIQMLRKINPEEYRD